MESLDLHPQCHGSAAVRGRLTGTLSRTPCPLRLGRRQPEGRTPAAAPSPPWPFTFPWGNEHPVCDERMLAAAAVIAGRQVVKLNLIAETKQREARARSKVSWELSRQGARAFRAAAATSLSRGRGRGLRPRSGWWAGAQRAEPLTGLPLGPSPRGLSSWCGPRCLSGEPVSGLSALQQGDGRAFGSTQVPPPG